MKKIIPIIPGTTNVNHKPPTFIFLLKALFEKGNLFKTLNNIKLYTVLRLRTLITNTLFSGGMNTP